MVMLLCLIEYFDFPTLRVINLKVNVIVVRNIIAKRLPIVNLFFYYQNIINKKRLSIGKLFTIDF